MIGWLRGWWDDFSDRYYDKHSFRQGKVPLGGLRWRIAEWYNHHSPRCWSDLAEFAMGWRTTPGGKYVERCRESALECGSCYCGKYVSPEAAKVVPNPHERIVVPRPDATITP